MLGVIKCHFDRACLHFAQSLAAARLEGFKCQILQLVEVAHGEQAVADQICNFGSTANTNFQLAEFCMAYGNIRTQISNTMAVWTIRVAEQVTWSNVFGAARFFG